MAPRAMRTMNLSFGMVVIPVAVYKATESHNVEAHQVRATDGSRIRYRKVAELDGEEVGQSEIAKAYTMGDQEIVLTNDELAVLDDRLPSTREIAVDAFVDPGEVSPLMLDTAYYLAPVPKAGKAAVKAYRLFSAGLLRTRKVAVAKVMISSRERVAVIGVTPDGMVLHTLRWGDEVREPVEVPEAELTDQELALAEALINSLDTPELPEYTDHYQDTLLSLLVQKLQGAPLKREICGEPKIEEATDLTALLKGSLDQIRGKGIRSVQAHEAGITGAYTGAVMNLPVTVGAE